MAEQWTQIPIKEISEEYGRADYAKIVDNEQGLQIILVFENEFQVQFLFKTSVISYNVCDEGRRLRTLDFIAKQYGTDVFRIHPIYMVECSKYLEWFNEESYDIVSGYKINHYVFLTSNDVIDVLTTYAPEISLINATKKTESKLHSKYLTSFKDLYISKRELCDKLGGDLQAVRLDNPVVIFTTDVINLLNAYKRGRITVQHLIDWTNTVRFTDLFTYDDAGCDSIEGVLNKLAALEKDGRDLTERDINNYIKAIENSRES